MKIIRFISLSTLVVFLAWPGLGLAEPTAARQPAYQLMGRDAPPSANSPLNPNFVVADEAHLTEGGFWRSSFINESLVGLTATDIDGDGRQELVYASNRHIYVGRVDGPKLIQLVKHPINLTESALSVDALDLTGDGRPEIIVSIINDNHAAVSAIYSYSDGKLIPLVTKIGWYLRVVGSTGGRFLVGQRPNTDVTSTYSGSVMRMNFSNNKVKSGQKVNIPNFVNVFNFTLGRLGSSGLQMVAAIKFPSEHIFLYEGQEQVWESPKEYGGTMNYVEPPGVKPSETRKREFLPARILITDIDQDGQNELIVAKNDRGGIPFMSNQRSFTGGVIQAFKYVNLSLTPFFRTRSLPGPAVDYDLADIKNNGTKSLVVAVVTTQRSGMLIEGRSLIVAYDLIRSEPKPEEKK